MQETSLGENTQVNAQGTVQAMTRNIAEMYEVGYSLGRELVGHLEAAEKLSAQLDVLGLPGRVRKHAPIAEINTVERAFLMSIETDMHAVRDFCRVMDKHDVKPPEVGGNAESRPVNPSPPICDTPKELEDPLKRAEESQTVDEEERIVVTECPDTTQEPQTVVVDEEERTATECPEKPHAVVTPRNEEESQTVVVDKERARTDTSPRSPMTVIDVSVTRRGGNYTLFTEPSPLLRNAHEAPPGGVTPMHLADGHDAPRRSTRRIRNIPSHRKHPPRGNGWNNDDDGDISP